MSNLLKIENAVNSSDSNGVNSSDSSDSSDSNGVLSPLHHTQKKEREIPKCKKIETQNDIEFNDIEDNRVNLNLSNIKEWRSCCFSINSSAAKYFVQASVLTSLITYSAVMLVVNEDCNSQRNYSSLLMMCLGILIPSPKF